MARYRFTGESPVTVPDLARYEDNPVRPGEEFETEVVINNVFFDLLTPPVEKPKPNLQESEA